MSTKFEFSTSNTLAAKANISTQSFVRKIAAAIALCAPLVCATHVEAQVSSHTIPVTIQAEDFSTGSGVKNETSTDSGGGLYTAYINAGDWMNYLNHKVVIPVTGEYIISYRVSSLYEGSLFTFNNINSNGSMSKINRVLVPKTGGLQAWTTVQRTATLKAGPHYFGIKANNGGFTLNWIRITNVSSSSSTSSKAYSSKSAVVSSRAASSSSIKSSVPSSSKAASNLPTSSKAASSVRAIVSSSKAASVGVSSSKASSSKVASSLASSSKMSSSSVVSKSSASSAPNGYTPVAGPVGLTWIAPKLREDKTTLDITELGGYRLRYKAIEDSKYTYITINDPWTTTYNFSWLEGDYLFEIAAFDDAGLLSEFSSFTD